MLPCQSTTLASQIMFTWADFLRCVLRILSTQFLLHYDRSACCKEKHLSYKTSSKLCLLQDPSFLLSYSFLPTSFLKFLPLLFQNIFFPHPRVYILCLFSFFCFLSLIELYSYFLSPFKNISFFDSYLSALASPLSHCLDSYALLGCREAKHTDKLTHIHKQRKLRLRSLAVTDKLTLHWLGFQEGLLISTRSPPGHLSTSNHLLVVSLQCSQFFLVCASSPWNCWHFCKYICSCNGSLEQFR